MQATETKIVGNRIKHTCQNCKTAIRNKVSEAGSRDHCPECHVGFIVPGRAKVIEMKLKREQARKPKPEVINWSPQQADLKPAKPLVKPAVRTTTADVARDDTCQQIVNAIAVLCSLLFPGLGQVAQGRVSTGMTIAMFYILVWLAGAIAGFSIPVLGIAAGAAAVIAGLLVPIIWFGAVIDVASFKGKKR